MSIQEGKSRIIKKNESFKYNGIKDEVKEMQRFTYLMKKLPLQKNGTFLS